MPANKNLMVRVRVIDTCLRGTGVKYWSKQKLIEAIQDQADIVVSERTLDKDIELMRNSDQLRYYAPIKYCRRGAGYYYEDPDYSIEKLPLTDKDLAALELAAATLAQYSSVPTLADFSASINKVVTLVNQLKGRAENNSLSFIDFEKAPFSKGTEFIETLASAIKKKRVVELDYQKFGDAQSGVRLVSPLLLKEYRNRWYLLGVQHGQGRVKTFGLDRIDAVREINNAHYQLKAGFDAAVYFRNTIGISYEQGEVEEVILSFTPQQGNYVKTQHLHASQEIIVDNEQELKVRINVVINYELMSTILSFGSGVVVISPRKLRSKVYDTVKTCASQYAQ